MSDDPTTAGGTPAGEPTPAAASSPTDQDLLSSLEVDKGQLDPNADLWEKVRGVDFTKAPEDIRRKIEAPFLSISGKKAEEANRKIQEVEAQRQMLLSVVEKLANKNGEQPQPSADQRKQLLEEIANGDTNAIERLVDNLVQERTGPQMDYISKTRSIQEAAEMMPELPKYEAQVASALQADPDLLRLTAIDNRRYASKVLAGLAWRSHAEALAAKLAETEKLVESRIKAGIEAEQRRLKGLPPSTSQAGRTPTAFPTEKPMNITEAMEKAWADLGGE